MVVGIATKPMEEDGVDLGGRDPIGVQPVSGRGVGGP